MVECMGVAPGQMHENWIFSSFMQCFDLVIPSFFSLLSRKWVSKRRQVHIYALFIHFGLFLGLLCENHKNADFRIFGACWHSFSWWGVLPFSQTYRSASRFSAAFRPVSYAYLLLRPWVAFSNLWPFWLHIFYECWSFLPDAALA